MTDSLKLDLAAGLRTHIALNVGILKGLQSDRFSNGKLATAPPLELTKTA